MNFKHFIALNCLDIITTYIAISYMGLNELNPLYVAAFEKMGIEIGLVSIKIVVLMIIYQLIIRTPEIKIIKFYNLDARKIGVNTICIMFTFVVLNNLYHVARVILIS